MRYYKMTTLYACGIDLHARQMYVCVTDREGDVLLHINIRDNDFAYFLKKVAPWMKEMTVVCECLFCWPWLAEACRKAGIKFVLAHALYLKLIHGGKNKNDRLDSKKLADLLRTNLIPPSYIYPGDKLPVRALLRQRFRYVCSRAEILQRVENHQLSQGREPVARPQKDRDRWGDALMESELDERHQFSLGCDLAMVSGYDEAIASLEDELLRITKKDRRRDLYLLRTIPGIGLVLALTILYEIDDIGRFPTDRDLRSYCRLVKGTVASSGKIKGMRGGKMGNRYLRWAFGEAAVLGKRHDPRMVAMAQALEKRHGKFKANAVLANRLARSVFFMLKHGTAFDVEAFSAPVLARA